MLVCSLVYYWLPALTDVQSSLRDASWSSRLLLNPLQSRSSAADIDQLGFHVFTPLLFHNLIVTDQSVCTLNRGVAESGHVTVLCPNGSEIDIDLLLSARESTLFIHWEKIWRMQQKRASRAERCQSMRSVMIRVQEKDTVGFATQAEIMLSLLPQFLLEMFLFGFRMIQTSCVFDLI